MSKICACGDTIIPRGKKRDKMCRACQRDEQKQRKMRPFRDDRPHLRSEGRRKHKCIEKRMHKKPRRPA